MTEYSYTVLFEPAEEGGYVAFCPALPGLVTEGDTYDEVRTRVEEAIAGYLESLLKDGLPIPPDKKLTLEPVKEQVRVALHPSTSFWSFCNCLSDGTGTRAERRTLRADEGSLLSNPVCGWSAL